METKRELKFLFWMITIFVVAFTLPIESVVFQNATWASLDLLRWYAREHVVMCLLPAFYIAGVISVFVSQASVLRYFGATAKKWVAYTVASVSGAILAVCSCTILPLFSSIYKRGAGLGPAITFLYSGPAINILAIILTARVLGVELGIARTVGAILFSIIIGLIMSFIYRKEEHEKELAQLHIEIPQEGKPLWQTAFHFFVLVFLLVFINWGKPGSDTQSIWYYLWLYKWYIAGGFAIFLVYSLIKILKLPWTWVMMGVLATVLAVIVAQFIDNPRMAPLLPVVVAIASLALITLQDRKHEENREWTLASWEFAKQIMPLLLIGILIAGFLLGSTHDTVSIPGVVPHSWVYQLVGGNDFLSNLFASLLGAFMYFATLTEIPIIQGLMAAGMGKGPALALLLAGPSISLPSMLVIHSVLGTKKTIVYIILVITMATLAGFLYGQFF